MTIHIIIDDKRWKRALPSCERQIKKVASHVFKALKIDLKKAKLEVTITLTDDDSIRVLNREYRKKDKPTNVLSFPLMDITPPKFTAVKNTKSPSILGDVVISLDTVRAEAKEQKKALSDHVAHMVTHGLLHLLGYDHEVEREAEDMERLEARLLKQLGIANPYENP